MPKRALPVILMVVLGGTIALSPVAAHIAPGGTARPAGDLPGPLPSLTETPLPLPSLTETPLPSLTETPLPLPSLTETPLPLPSLTETPLPLPTETPLPLPSPSPSPPTIFPDGEIPHPDPETLPQLPLEEVIELTEVPPPPLGTGAIITVHLTRAGALGSDGLKYRTLTFLITPEGTVETINAITKETSEASPRGLAIAECDDGAYSTLTPRWTAGAMPIGWRLDRRSIPGRLPKTKVKRKIKKAFESWTLPNTRCDLPSDTSFSFTFDGTTGRNPKFDSVNTVDFGRLDGGLLALTSAYFVENKVVEFDIRFNKTDHKWTVYKKNRKRFQISNVAAHEIGHALSLDDLGSPHDRLTMYGIILKGELHKQSLGRGDVLGAQTTGP